MTELEKLTFLAQKMRIEELEDQLKTVLKFAQLMKDLGEDNE